MFLSRYPNLNALWSSLIIEELWRLGVRDCCIAPGSRSAPLTLAAAAHRGLRKHIHFDERGLAFFALGIAQRSKRPVVVITTSGTAVANLYPAVIEARQSGVPLIAITADRPVELIGCGANQTIEQQGIYAGYPGATLNFPTPTAEISTSWVVSSVDQAFAKSCRQGLPMHINCMFREPLYPANGINDYGELLACNQDWLRSDKPYTLYCSPKGDAVSGNLDIWKQLLQRKGIIIVGRMSSNNCIDDLLALAATLHWPIFADIQSQLHGHPAVISHVDLLLASVTGQQLTAAFDSVLQIGGHVVSKRLSSFLERDQWQQFIQLDEECRQLDTGRRQGRHFVAPVDSICRSLIALSVHVVHVNDNRSAALARMKKLKAHSDRLLSFINRQFADDELTEAWIAANIGLLLPLDCGLFVGNSLPVRLLNMFSMGNLQCVYSNRGASGIDGLLATAAGCAISSEQPLVAIVGDLSMLHDVNSLALANKVDRPFVIIVLNNDGGGIFNLLPLSNIPEQAERYFQTPHGLDASHAASMFAVNYYSPTCQRQFQAVLSESLDNQGCSLIEIKTMPGQAARQIGQAMQKVEVL